MSRVLISRLVSFDESIPSAIALLLAKHRMILTRSYKTTTLVHWSRNPLTQVPPLRHFSLSPLLKKKKDKGNTAGDTKIDPATSKALQDPFDLAQLQIGISDALSRFKHDLSQLRAGGRLNTETIESLRVTITKGGKETARLGDLAQVMPKGGRAMTILVLDEDLVKPVTSAILASGLSLTPQQDLHSPLQLNIPIPPPTKESREKTSQAAKSAMEKAVGAVRSSRATVHKRLQDMQKKKEARPDDVRKAHDQMEKLVEKGQKEIRDAFEVARKALE